MKRFILAALAASTIGAVSARAETEEECRARWKVADVDGNGALEASIDNPDYVKALNASAAISRDEFLKRCTGGALASLPKPNTPAENKELGKGDITPGPPLAKEDAQKKLKAVGYGDVTDLKLDDKGVWRGTGTVNGKQTSVAVDPQGDVLAH